MTNQKVLIKGHNKIYRIYSIDTTDKIAFLATKDAYYVGALNAPYDWTYAVPLDAIRTATEADLLLYEEV